MVNGEAPGWETIERALAAVHGDAEPLHYAPVVPVIAGGRDPLHGISFYRVASPLHWHAVTFGFTELFAKETDDPTTSGFGFELTFRLARRPRDAKPPSWAFSFLQNLARYVFSSGNAFAENHHLDCRGPIARRADTKLVAVAFARDPGLEPVTSPHGRFEFLQVVGIARDELDAIADWDSKGFIELLRERDPLLLTDLGRASILDEPAIARRVKKRTRAEGSSMAVTFVAHARWERTRKRVRVEIGATGVKSLVRGLTLRVPFGREFALAGREGSIVLVPGKSCGARARGRELRMSFDPGAAKALARRVRARRGKYAVEEWPGLEVEVVPSEIKDAEGRVVETIG